MERESQIQNKETWERWYILYHRWLQESYIDIVTDEKDDTKLVVYKCWLKYKGYWGYYCQRMSSLLYQICLLYEDTIPKKSRVKFYEMNEVDPEGWVK